MRKNILLSLSVLIVLLATAFFMSCGDGGSSSGGDSTGSVALYLTDSPEDEYQDVKINVNDVQLVHTGSDTSCDILNGIIINLDITDLASALRFVQSSECESRSYNRIHMEFDKQVELTENNNNNNGESVSCDFTSYKDTNNNPKTLQCNGDTCFIDINGSVNVLANQNNKLALDFELKDFEIDRSIVPCTVTIKVSPLHASGIKEKIDNGYNEGISGFISPLTLTEDSFQIKLGSEEFTVFYDNIGGIYNALLLAQSDALEVEVEAVIIDLVENEITASAIYVEVVGTVSSLNEGAGTFTLTYPTSKTITVDYNNAEVNGTLDDTASVEVKLNGYDGPNYLAIEVEIEG